MENDEIKNEVEKAKVWVKFTQMGMQMALTIGLLTWAGYWLDGKMENKNPIMTLIFSLGSIAISLYNVIRQLPKE